MISVQAEVLLKYPFVFLTGFLCSYLLTPLVRRCAREGGLVDRPKARHIHTRPVPVCGISVFLAFHIACAVIFLVPWTPFRGELDALWWWQFLLLSGSLISLGMLDDLVELRPLVKLAGQLIVALVAYHFDMRVGRLLGVDLPGPVDLLATLFWFVSIINAFNLIDGIDGLATGLGSIAALGLAGSFLIRRQPGDALVMLGLIGACFGFLRYNFHPASIFLGDSGSMFLGFVIASVALSTSTKGTAVVSIMVPLLAVGVPMFDTFLAVWRRTVRRMLGRADAGSVQPTDGVFHGDTDHVHHRLLRQGMSHKSVASSLYVLSAALVGVGLLSALYQDYAAGIYMLSFLLAAYVAVRHLAQVELWDSGKAIVSGMRRPPNRVLAVLIYLPLDLLLLSGALALAILLSGAASKGVVYRHLWIDSVPIWVGLPFLLLFAIRAYHRVWTRAHIWEYALLIVALLFGIGMAAGLWILVHQTETIVLVRQILIYACLAIPLLTATRGVPRAVEEGMGMVWAKRDTPDEEGRQHTLVYGTGRACGLYLENAGFDLIDGDDRTHIIGLLDNDANLHGRFVHGFPVLGGTDKLMDLIEDKHVEALMITEPLEDPLRRQIVHLCREMGVCVSEQRTVVDVLLDPEQEQLQP